MKDVGGELLQILIKEGLGDQLNLDDESKKILQQYIDAQKRTSESELTGLHRAHNPSQV